MHLSYVRAALCGSYLILLTSALLAQETESSRSEQDRIVTLPKDYRNWQLIGVAHEAGSLNDIRAMLGNNIAVNAFKSGVRPFPDGAIVVRLAYKHVASEQNNIIFGQLQSFVAGEPTNVQISVKDYKKYPMTGGWGYGQFVNGKSDAGSQPVMTCFACHNRLPASHDLVFTEYAP